MRAVPVRRRQGTEGWGLRTVALMRDAGPDPAKVSRPSTAKPAYARLNTAGRGESAARSPYPFRRCPLITTRITWGASIIDGLSRHRGPGQHPQPTPEPTCRPASEQADRGGIRHRRPWTALSTRRAAGPHQSGPSTPSVCPVCTEVTAHTRQQRDASPALIDWGFPAVGAPVTGVRVRARQIVARSPARAGFAGRPPTSRGSRRRDRLAVRAGPFRCLDPQD
jgi:hypothetical protein